MNILAENRKARYDYEILEKYEAGLVLQGQEVKSIKNGRITLVASYITFRKEEPWLVGATVPPWQPKNAPADYNPSQPRKLLLNKKEIQYLTGRSNQRGIALVPLKVYEKNGRIKLEFGVARGRKQFNKKEKLKQRDVERSIQQALK